MIAGAEKNFQLFFISLFPLCSQKPFNGPKVGEIVIGVFTKLSDWSLLKRFWGDFEQKLYTYGCVIQHIGMCQTTHKGVLANT
jgi:hypothetical protein